MSREINIHFSRWCNSRRICIYMVSHIICISLPQVYSKNIIFATREPERAFIGASKFMMPYRNYFKSRRAFAIDRGRAQIRGDRDNNKENAGLDFFASPRDSSSECINAVRHWRTPDPRMDRKYSRHFETTAAS